MSIVVFSPHLDDAIFSIGAHLTSLDDVRIVCPFAGIPPDAVGRNKYEILIAEHLKSCTALGITGISNGEFFDDVYPAPRRSTVRDWLQPYLDAQHMVYIPCGIRHPDHVMISQILIGLLDTVDVTPACIRFYEEMPYRVDSPVIRDARLDHIENTVGRLRKIDVTYLENTRAQKLAAVRCYASQIDDGVVNRVMHPEQVWELVR